MLDFLKKKMTFDSEGFDAEGYNRLGFNRMGYDRDGYDMQGFNREGFSRKGINKLTGLDNEGYDADGFNKDGFDRLGFDRNGFNAAGFDKDGYDRYGFNSDGFDIEGYDNRGFNSDGYDREGFNEKGMDSDGYDREGFDTYGYNREGFDKDGYDRDGYDIDGYNAKGFDREGYDREGFDKHGYDREGYDSTGFNKLGYDREGYDTNGYDPEGYDREGYDVDGFNSDGYDSEGYDRSGFNSENISRMGFGRDEFDEEGFHKNTGLDVWGFNRFGYNINGINKYTKRDRLGFDSAGLDEDGFNIWGIDLDIEEDKYGNSIDIYEDDEAFTEEKCNEFEKMYYEYMAGNYKLATKLAWSYCYGEGTVRDYRKAIRVLIDTANENSDMESIRELADIFYIGEVIRQNINMSNYLNDIVDSKKIKSINQYKARQALKFSQPIDHNDEIYNEEMRHLESVLQSIKNKIEKKKNRLIKIDSDTSWMDYDQLRDWQLQKRNNIEVNIEIDNLERILAKPYYGRMDVKHSTKTDHIYIGENEYQDLNNESNNISIVWSEMGRHFRDSRRNAFTFNGDLFTVSLRRKFVIENGKLLDFYDEYESDSEGAKSGITDPYLIHILEEKRGEENITNIIRSIQSNQNDIIEEDFNSNIVVQGCAGSGKTMILLHRLANLKYKNRDYDWDHVRIITPNNDFTLFIDDLSKDLRINDIKKLTLADYYIELIKQYHDQFLERVVDKDEIRTVHYGNFNISSENKKIKKDGSWDREIVEYIYSDEFREELSDRVSELKEEHQDVLTFGTAWDEFDDTIREVLEGNDFKIPKRIPNYNCILYAKLLFLYLFLGRVRDNAKMLCIDEGQDISENQYVLIYEVNGGRSCLNVYGDLNQRVVDNVSISDWESLEDLIGAKYYELNENYRNSEEIIEFYNNILGINNKSFGLSTKPVEQFDIEEMDILIKLQVLLKNRTVIITKDRSRVPTSVLNMCIQGGIAKDHVSIMNVLEVKGLEFDTAFVFDDDMDENEKYISYTRALSELYTQSNNGVEDIALGFGDEQDAIEKKLDEKEDDDIEVGYDEEIRSICELDGMNKNKLLIVVRNLWSNDFCFVVERYEEGWAIGTEYLNGNEYRQTKFDMFRKEFRMYNGSSREKIENQYEVDD